MNELVPYVSPPQLAKANTLANRVGEYLKDLQDRKCSEFSVRNMRVVLEHFELFCAGRHVIPQTVREWCDAVGTSGRKPGTVDLYQRHLKSFLIWMDRRDYITGLRELVRVFNRVTIPKRPVTTITLEEYERLRDASVGTPMYYLVVMGYWTGLRGVGACLLQWVNVDLERFHIRVVERKVSKWGITSTPPIPPGGELHAMLVEMQRNPSDEWPGRAYVHPYWANEYMKGYLPDSKFSALCKKVGVKKSYHDFRRGYTSTLLDAGVSPALVAKMTGHSNIQELMTYYKADEAAMHAAMNSAFAKQKQQTGSVTLTQ